MGCSSPYCVLALVLFGTGLVVAAPKLDSARDENSILVTGVDNELVGDPVVDCEDEMIALTFKTKKPFTGRVFVQGMAQDERCAKNFASNSEQSKFSMMIQNGDCTMQRERISGSLEGMMLSLTIVVSFHGTFVTKSDRAFRCMCFFRNIHRVTQSLDMNAIAVTELLDTARMPTCSYAIHLGSPTGPVATQSNVGEKIFHVWSCESSPDHGFLVHSCFVDDGTGGRFDLLDVDGCAIDPIIQPDVVYDFESGIASTETWGYKFSDSSVLNYQCIVELCKKSAGECVGLVPPSCNRIKSTGPGTGHSRRRSIDPTAMEMDVATTLEVTAIIPEKAVTDPRHAWEGEELSHLTVLRLDKQPTVAAATAIHRRFDCFGPIALALGVAVAISLILSAIVLVCIQASRPQK